MRTFAYIYYQPLSHHHRHRRTVLFKVIITKCSTDFSYIGQELVQNKTRTNSADIFFSLKFLFSEKMISIIFGQMLHEIGALLSHLYSYSI